MIFWHYVNQIKPYNTLHEQKEENHSHPYFHLHVSFAHFQFIYRKKSLSKNTFILNQLVIITLFTANITYISACDSVIHSPAYCQVPSQWERSSIEGICLPALDGVTHSIHSGVDWRVGTTDLESHNDAAWKMEMTSLSIITA